MKEIRLGTIGSGEIVHNILDGVARTEGICLEAVYSRSREKGSALAAEYGASKVYTDMDAMLADEEKNTPRNISVATGEAAYGFISKLVEKAKKACPHLQCRVYCVKNVFFGGQVTVAGLITGRDLAEQLSGNSLGEEVLLSRTMLRAEGDMFLCNMTPEELSEKLGVPLRFSDCDGAEFLDALLGLGGEIRRKA